MLAAVACDEQAWIGGEKRFRQRGAEDCVGRVR